VGGTGANHDDGEDINFSAKLMAAESFGRRGVLVADKLCGVIEVSICAILSFAELNPPN
jgi:hypothetical protein